MRLSKLTVIFLLLFSTIFWANKIRVKIVDFKRSIFTTVYRNTSIKFLYNKTRVDSIKIKSVKRLVFVRKKDFTYCEYNGKIFQGDRIVIEGKESKVLRRKFRGKIDIITLKHRAIVVNVIDMSDYLKGVLTNEISPAWNVEALKAMAIISRTYAYKQILNHNKYYDVESTVASQVYSGLYGEDKRTNKAVDLTKGLIVVYDSKPIEALFHSCCGGYLEDAYNVWGKSYPYLVSKKSNFCVDTPHYKFKTSISRSSLSKKIADIYKYKPKTIKDIVPYQITVSGRVNIYRIIFSDNSKIDIKGNRFRQIVGYDVLRSLRSYVVMKKKAIEFIGKGWGHGVGMCQWGAYKMAMLGYNYKQIIKYYYRNTNIVHYKLNK